MQFSLIGVPEDAEVISRIVEKNLKNGMRVEVYLVKHHRQYEAALFLEGHFKPGPPVPRQLETPTEAAAYWMGVRPKIGLSQEEGDEILNEVSYQNRVNHCNFVDKWGTVSDD